MPPARTASRLLRTALAAVFGFMTLGHGPVMAFAKAGAAAGHHAHAQPLAAGHRAHAQPAASHHHSHHHAMPVAGDEFPDDEDFGHHPPDARHAPPVCYSVGCFAAVGPAAANGPAADGILLGKLKARGPRAAEPADVEPAIPPPRLQV